MHQQFILLKEKIDERTGSISDNRLYYRNRAYRLFISTTILSALVTVLLGLNIGEFDIWLKKISLVITSIITILSAYNSFFNHKDLWITNNTALNKFYELKFNMEYREKDPTAVTQVEVDEFKKAYQSILNELNTNWAKSRTIK
jgi:hypothetical protein